MTKTDFNHNWEEIEEALKKREESMINQAKIASGKLLNFRLSFFPLSKAKNMCTTS